jgi:hypothetical protein
MKIAFTQRWTFRGIGERGPIHIDYAPGTANVPRHIAAQAIEAGVANEYSKNSESGQVDRETERTS